MVDNYDTGDELWLEKQECWETSAGLWWGWGNRQSLGQRSGVWENLGDEKEHGALRKLQTGQGGWS